MYVEKGQTPYDFDKSYMKRVSKEDFLEAHKHLEDLIDLPAEWDKHNPEKATPSKDKEKAKG